MTEKEYAIRPNKSQIKRDIKELSLLVKELLNMPKSTLDSLSISAETRNAIIQVKTFKRGALQRQLKLIAKLMQQEDKESIEREIIRIKQPTKQQNQHFHQLEEYRERLLQGDANVYSELLERFPDIDLQHTRQLVRNATTSEKQEALTPVQSNKITKFKRQLFQHLRELSE